MVGIQIVLFLFLVFALSRVILRFREKTISPLEFVFWAMLFFAAIVGVAFPNETTNLARFVGIGRGVDLVIYASIATLFYLVFRIYVLMEGLHHEITELIRQLALKDIYSSRKNKNK